MYTSGWSLCTRDGRDVVVDGQHLGENVEHVLLWSADVRARLHFWKGEGGYPYLGNGLVVDGNEVGRIGIHLQCLVEAKRGFNRCRSCFVEVSLVLERGGGGDGIEKRYTSTTRSGATYDPCKGPRLAQLRS